MNASRKRANRATTTPPFMRDLAPRKKGKGNANKSAPIDMPGNVEDNSPSVRHVEEDVQIFSEDSLSSHDGSLHPHPPRSGDSLGGDADDTKPVIKPPKVLSVKLKDGKSTSASKRKTKSNVRCEAQALHTVRLKTVQFNKKAHAFQTGGIFCYSSHSTPHCTLKLFDRWLELKLESYAAGTLLIEASQVLQTSWRADRMLEFVIKVSPGFHFREDFKDWHKFWANPPQHLLGRESPSENIFLFEVDSSMPSNTVQQIHQIINQWSRRDLALLSSDHLWDTFPLPPLSSDHYDGRHGHVSDTKPGSLSKRSRRQDLIPQDGTLDFKVATLTSHDSASGKNRHPATQSRSNGSLTDSISRQTPDKASRSTTNGSSKNLKTLALEILDQNGLKLLGRTASGYEETKKRQQRLGSDAEGDEKSVRSPVEDSSVLQPDALSNSDSEMQSNQEPNEQQRAAKATLDATGAAPARKVLCNKPNTLVPRHQKQEERQRALPAKRQREQVNVRNFSATALAVGQEPIKKRCLCHHSGTLTETEGHMIGSRATSTQRRAVTTDDIFSPTIGSRATSTQSRAVTTDDIFSPTSLPENEESRDSNCGSRNGDVKHDISSDVNGDPFEPPAPTVAQESTGIYELVKQFLSSSSSQTGNGMISLPNVQVDLVLELIKRETAAQARTEQYIQLLMKRIETLETAPS